MEAFGDESGHLDQLLRGECELFVLGVVAGNSHDCRACPKRAVRDVRDLDEAKWNDLTDLQKRRFVDCLLERTDGLSFAYVAFEADDLLALDNDYLLFQDDAFRYSWDITLMGIGYAETVQSLLPTEVSSSTFTFDRIYSKKISNRLAEVFSRETSAVDIDHAPSTRVQQIQTADCFAGAVSEHVRGGANWLDRLPEKAVTDSTDFALARIERFLYEASTGP